MRFIFGIFAAGFWRPSSEAKFLCGLSQIKKLTSPSHVYASASVTLDTIIFFEPWLA
jgi:hypothetical protein